jgi:3-hydroxybutyryl-CoA dehydratase
MGSLKDESPDGRPFPAGMNAILAYAELTQDFNPLHVDPGFAATTSMGGVIAHGTMSLGLILRAVADELPEGGVLELDVRFISPVRVGDELTPLISKAVDGAGLQALVRGADGQDRITGTVRLGAAAAP